MKVVPALAVSLALLVVVRADLMTFLKDIQSHASFQHLSADEKILFSELVMAAEQNTLEAFIDRVGLLSVIKLIDDMSFADAHLFEAYLAEHLGYHNHDIDLLCLHLLNCPQPSTSNIVKRDAHNHGHGHDFAHKLEGYSGQIPHDDKKTWDDLVHAAMFNQVTQFIDQHGYGVIFGLLEHLDAQSSQEVINMLETQLQKEAAMATA